MNISFLEITDSTLSVHNKLPKVELPFELLSNSLKEYLVLSYNYQDKYIISSINTNVYLYLLNNTIIHIIYN